MTKPLVVWGMTLGPRRELFPEARQTRAIVATTSKAAAVRAFTAAGFYLTMYEFNAHAAETGNDVEVPLATASPGVVFAEPLDNNGADKVEWTAIPDGGLTHEAPDVMPSGAELIDPPDPTIDPPDPTAEELRAIADEMTAHLWLLTAERTDIQTRLRGIADRIDHVPLTLRSSQR